MNTRGGEGEKRRGGEGEGETNAFTLYALRSTLYAQLSPHHQLNNSLLEPVIWRVVRNHPAQFFKRFKPPGDFQCFSRQEIFSLVLEN